MEVIDMYVDSVAVAPRNSANVSNKSYTTAETSNTTAYTEIDGAQQAVQSKGDKDISTDNELTAADNEKIKKALENMKAQLPNSEVKFGIHEKTGRVTIKLIDQDTKEVIKEFPPEKTLDMIAKCMEIAGVLVDEKL
jgi:flagellar protein FlaG